MALVELTHDDTIAVGLPAYREWVYPALGEAGVARVRIPYTNPAASSDYIDPDGGSRLRIYADADSGVWDGVITGIDYDRDALTVTARQAWQQLAKMPVAANQTLQSVSAGEIVNSALAATPFGIKGVAVSAPAIDVYQFTGQPAWTVIADMMNRTGLEIQVDEDGLVSWGRFGSFYDGLFVAGGSMHDVTYSLDITNRASRVTVTSGDLAYTASDMNTADSLWKPHEVVQETASSYSELIALAESHLSQRGEPDIQVSGRIGPDYWDIREGDYLQLLVPYARLGGATEMCRVVRRVIDERGVWMVLGLQVVPDIMASQTTGARGSTTGRQQRDQRSLNHIIRRLQQRRQA